MSIRHIPPPSTQWLSNFGPTETNASEFMKKSSEWAPKGCPLDGALSYFSLFLINRDTGEAMAADQIAPISGEPVNYVAATGMSATYEPSGGKTILLTAKTGGVFDPALALTVGVISADPIDANKAFALLDVPGAGVAITPATSAGDKAIATITMSGNDSVFEVDAAGPGGDDHTITMSLPSGGPDPFGNWFVEPSYPAPAVISSGTDTSVLLATDAGTAGTIVLTESDVGATTGNGVVTLTQKADYVGEWANGHVNGSILIAGASTPFGVDVTLGATDIDVVVNLQTDANGDPVAIGDYLIASAINTELEGVAFNGIANLGEVFTATSTGVRQVETAIAVGTITTAGTAIATVTSSLVTGTPLIVPFSVMAGDTAAVWADKAKVALLATSAVSTHYTVGGSGANITLTAKIAAANVVGLNIALADGGCGITEDLTSTDTTPGAVGVTAQVETATVVAAANVTHNSNIYVTVTAAAISPVLAEFPIAVVNGETAIQVATKIRTALNVAGVTDHFTIGATVNANVVLTATTQLANDTTLNIAIRVGDSAGITEDATSDNTTAGVAPGFFSTNLPAVAMSGAVDAAGDDLVNLTSTLEAVIDGEVGTVISLKTAGTAGGHYAPIAGATVFAFTGGGANPAITTTLAELKTALDGSTLIGGVVGSGDGAQVIVSGTTTLTGGTDATLGTPGSLGQLAIGFAGSETAVKSVWTAMTHDLTPTQAGWVKTFTGS